MPSLAAHQHVWQTTTTSFRGRVVRVRERMTRRLLADLALLNIIGFYSAWRGRRCTHNVGRCRRRHRRNRCFRERSGGNASGANLAEGEHRLPSPRVNGISSRSRRATVMVACHMYLLSLGSGVLHLLSQRLNIFGLSLPPLWLCHYSAWKTFFCGRTLWAFAAWQTPFAKSRIGWRPLVLAAGAAAMHSSPGAIAAAIAAVRWPLSSYVYQRSSLAFGVCRS